MQSESEEKFELKVMRLPVVNMSAGEIAAYEKNPANKPKLDSLPKGKTAPPSKKTDYHF
jgi:hypothetical protein